VIDLSNAMRVYRCRGSYRCSLVAVKVRDTSPFGLRIEGYVNFL